MLVSPLPEVPLPALPVKKVRQRGLPVVVEPLRVVLLVKPRPWLKVPLPGAGWGWWAPQWVLASALPRQVGRRWSIPRRGRAIPPWRTWAMRRGVDEDL